VYNSGDMKEDPRVEGIRAAYDAALFDERTSDERGFAATFEGFKPRLKENIPLNLRNAVIGRRRARLALLIAAIVAISFIPLLILLNSGDEEASGKVFYGMIGFVLIIVAVIATRRPLEEDPTRKLMIGAVLERFGCRVEPLDVPKIRINHASPITPAIAWLEASRYVVVGNFDGHLPFTAFRVIAWRQEGKSRVVSFRGWHLVIDLPFAFSGTTVVNARSATHKLRSGMALQAVGLEDPEFSRLLVARSDDQVEARIILSPDVIQHVASSAARLDRGEGGFMLGFSGSQAHVWIPSNESALSDWRPLHPPKLIEDIHESFAEMSEIRAFLRDIDVIAESEGFRAQAARNARGS
jgi:hypothetical protein